MSYRVVPLIEKLPEEIFTTEVDFVDVLGESETISSAAVTVVERDTGTDVSGTLLSGSPSVVGTAVRYDLRNGEEGISYMVAVVATLNTGEKREQWVRVSVPSKSSA